MIDLERSRTAGLGVDVVPIVEPKRHVAVFLHFKNDHVAQRVNRPSRHENAIPEFRAETCEVVRNRLVGDCPPHIVGRAARLEARVDAAFGSRFQHHPGFGLAGFAGRQIVGLPIRWMHLHREHAAYIEELQQQREAAEASGQFSQHLLRRLLEQLPKGPAFERAIGDETGMVVAVAQ